MKKIVINCCYGGFGLSYEGVMYYAKLKGFQLYAYVEKQSDNASDGTIVPFEKGKGETPPLIYYATKGGLKNRNELNKFLWRENDIKRDDPALVKTVEDLGEKANSICSFLKVVEVPDDVDWEITECGGWEQVEEKRRVWT